MSFITAILFGALGYYLVWLGEKAIKDEYIVAGMKQRFLYGITHYEGKSAVRLGWTFVVVGYGVMGIAVLMLLYSLMFIAMLMFGFLYVLVFGAAATFDSGVSQTGSQDSSVFQERAAAGVELGSPESSLPILRYDGREQVPAISLGSDFIPKW